MITTKEKNKIRRKTIAEIFSVICKSEDRLRSKREQFKKHSSLKSKVFGDYSSTMWHYLGGSSALLGLKLDLRRYFEDKDKRKYMREYYNFTD